MFSTAGLELLDALCSEREASANELAAATGHSRKQIYRVLDSFREAGLLVEFRRQHNERVVRLTDSPVVEAYRQLTATHSHIDWPALLSPATIRVCWYLDEPQRISEIADRLAITRQAVHNAVAPFKNRAMLVPSGPEYALGDDLQPVLAFCREVIRHTHRRRVRTRAPSATIVWCDPIRALVQVQTAADTDALQQASDWEMTGLARFQEYGLQFLLAGEPAFWYAPADQLPPAEIVCHTLVREAGSRRVSYALLLIEQAQLSKDELLETAAWYGIESLVTHLYQFIEDDVDTTDAETMLPSDREYAALKDQYGVA